jgi:hypothetical protein
MTRPVIHRFQALLAFGQAATGDDPLPITMTWLYYRFPLSFREVEELLLARRKAR